MKERLLYAHFEHEFGTEERISRDSFTRGNIPLYYKELIEEKREPQTTYGKLMLLLSKEIESPKSLDVDIQNMRGELAQLGIEMYSWKRNPRFFHIMESAWYYNRSELYIDAGGTDAEIRELFFTNDRSKLLVVDTLQRLATTQHCDQIISLVEDISPEQKEDLHYEAEFIERCKNPYPK